MRQVNKKARYDEALNNWVEQTDTFFLVGLTDFAQAFMGDLEQINDLPTIGTTLAKEAVYCTLESQKVTSEAYLPIGGKVVAINEEVIQQPSLINEDCYEKGWILKITATNLSEWNQLQSADFYTEAIRSFFNK